jgi:hypothetical protein
LLALPFTLEIIELNAPRNGPKFGAPTFFEGGAVSTTETLLAFSFHFSFTMLTTICFEFSMLNIYGCHYRAEQLCTELLLQSLMTTKSALVGRARPQKGGNN